MTPTASASGVRSPASLGVVILCHDRLALAARMARIWAEGGAAVVIHVDSKAAARDVAGMAAGLADLPDVRFCRRIRCGWGRFSLVEATQIAAETLLAAFPGVTHVYLASGACLPLRPVAELTAYLAQDPCGDHIESVDAREARWTVGGLDVERFTLLFPFDWRRRRRVFDWSVAVQRRTGFARRVPEAMVPHLGSQWWCLTARTLRAILQDPRRAEFDRYFRRCWIPDESYFQTLARRHSQSIQNHSLTLAKFDPFGRPYHLYDDHLTLLEESRCFVARKIWPHARRLYDHFPVAVAAAPGIDAAGEPDASRMAQVIDRAVARRRLGRPGLYMQSRFPRKDRENGKTSAPYTVLQGLSDLVPDIEPWLADRVRADVHGHLLGAERAEFAGRPEVGPGAISSNAALRDHHRQGFLAALIRITDRMQVFQFGPRDNQDLNWFMATDPNATWLVITGAWAVPLMQSDMPFDDVRNMAARLERIEQDQMRVLNSVWVKARVRIWSLAEFRADPQAVLTDVLRAIDPTAAAEPTLPAVRSTEGMAPFLRRLRNAGLNPTLTGLFPMAPDPAPGRTDRSDRDV